MILEPTWVVFERIDVPYYDNPRETYLTRWKLVQTPLFGVFLHRFSGPDPRSTLHDHPWNFLSIVLLGGYIERTELGTRSVRWVNHKRATDLHCILRLSRNPTWTLMFVGRRTRTWGYRDENGWTSFDQHAHNDEFLAALATREKADHGR